jgi:DNA polymerase/3'-5' exonuclease PolX
MTQLSQNIVKNLKILQEYEIISKQPFKAKAYNKVIDQIELYGENISCLEDIDSIKGIGEGIHKKIAQLVNEGKIDAVEMVLKDKKYILAKNILNVYGIGPAKLSELLPLVSKFEDLYLENIYKLLNEKQKIGLQYYNDLLIRIPYAEGMNHHKVISSKIDSTITFEMVGSYRRKNKDMGDIDILIKNQDGFKLTSIVTKLKSSGYIMETLASGKNKFMGICKLDNLPARRIDILVAEPSYYYFALLYFTGSYNFNIYMRRIALKKNLSLSEYGFKDNKTKEFVKIENICSEEDIFKYLDIPYVLPENRL